MTFKASDKGAEPIGQLIDPKTAPGAKSPLTGKELAAKPKETKAERFVRLAEFRTTKVLKRIKALGNLGNSSVYEYTPEQVELVFAAIAKELETARGKFSKALPVEEEFKLT